MKKALLVLVLLMLTNCAYKPLVNPEIFKFPEESLPGYSKLTAETKIEMVEELIKIVRDFK